MEEEEKSMRDRKADGVAIDRGKKILYLLEFKRTTDQRADLRREQQCGLKNNMRMWWER